MTSERPLNILVLGAGELGIGVLKSLAQHSNRGSAIITDSSKKAVNKSLTSLGIRFLEGDIANGSEDELASKFKPFDTVVSCTGMTVGSGKQLKIARAVLTAKVPRYLHWQFGVDYDLIGREADGGLFAEQVDVRNLLRGQSLTSWVIISNGIFMSYLFEDFWGVVDQDRSVVRALGSWDNKVTVTKAEDIGRMTAEVVLVDTELENQVVRIGGDTISYGRLADLLDQFKSKKVKREEWMVAKLKKDLDGEPDNGLLMYRVVFAEGVGVSWDLETTYNSMKGITLQSVKSWLRIQK